MGKAASKQKLSTKSYAKKPKYDREYRLEVKTISIDGITDAIEEVITELHNHPTPNRKFMIDESRDLTAIKKIMGEDADNFTRSVRKLKSRLFYLEKWDQLDPMYTFRATDTARDKVDEYTITFKRMPELTMVVDIYEKGIADNTPVTHTSHMVDLTKPSSNHYLAFRKHLGDAFSLIGVAVLVELLAV